MTVVYDIETCPLPLGSLTDRQARRLEIEGARVAEREPELSLNEAVRKAGALHAQIGWVCCVSFAVLNPDRSVADVTSVTADRPGAEADLLRDFWAMMEIGQTAHAVTFNGKWFDAPFLRYRSLYQQVPLPAAACVVLDTHRWRDRPHLDLAHVVSPVRVGLDDLCEDLGVPSPKHSMSGKGVSHAVEQGRIDEVARYCEDDVVATAHCYRALHDLRQI